MPNLNVSHSSISTVSGIEEQGQQDDKFGKQMENTYQLGENMTETDCTTFSLTNKLCIDKVLIRSPRYVLDFIVSSPNVQTENIAIQMHSPVPHPSSLTYIIKCLVFCCPYFFCNAGPFKRIPVSAVTEILKDVLTTYLQEEKYEVEWSQKMTKTISEVITSLNAQPLNTLKFPLHPVSLVNCLIVSSR